MYFFLTRIGDRASSKARSLSVWRDSALKCLIGKEVKKNEYERILLNSVQRIIELSSKNTAELSSKNRRRHRRRRRRRQNEEEEPVGSHRKGLRLPKVNPQVVLRNLLSHNRRAHVDIEEEHARG